MLRALGIPVEAYLACHDDYYRKVCESKLCYWWSFCCWHCRTVTAGETLRMVATYHVPDGDYRNNPCTRGSEPRPYHHSLAWVAGTCCRRPTTGVSVWRRRRACTWGMPPAARNRGPTRRCKRVTGSPTAVVQVKFWWKQIWV